MWATACLIVTITASACGSADSPPPRTTVAASCQGIDDLDSYRYSIVVRLQAPAFETRPGASPAAPLGEFAETLTALLSDFEIRGAHVAPDRTQAILQFKEDEVEVRAIGDARWERFGTTWEQQATPAPDVGFLTPTIVCEDIVLEIADGLDRSQAQHERINGVDAARYTLDKADLSLLPQLLGTDASTELPDEFLVDVWLAKDGEWPVKLEITAEDTDEQGNPLSMRLFMELRDVNDRGISIDEPVVNAPTG